MQQSWPLIDVTKRSIEETAATILAHFARHREGAVES
jgi:regulator of PEP synthase PpsR (kinase-PPPase family)